MSKDLQFKKHNSYIKINQMRSQLSLQQHRAFDALIILIQKNGKYTVEDLTDGKEIVFDLGEFKEYLMINAKTKKINRSELKNNIEDMMKITLSFDNKDDDEDNFTFYSIFEKAKVDVKNNNISFVFSRQFSSEHMLPTQKYTLLSADYINRLTKTYSRILYPHFKMLKGRDNFRSSIKYSQSFLVNMMGLADKSSYKKPSEMFSKVIKPSIEEINEKTDIKVSEASYEKSGGKYIFLFVFDYKSKDEKKPVQKPLIEEDGVYDPEFFDDNKEPIEGEMMENPNQLSLYAPSDLTPDISNIKTSEDFRLYMIQNLTGKVLPSITFENGDVKRYRIRPDGRLEIAKTGSIELAILAKIAWQIFFNNKDIIIKYQHLFSERTDIIYDENGVVLSIFDIYEEDSKNDIDTLPSPAPRDEEPF